MKKISLTLSLIIVLLILVGMIWSVVGGLSKGQLVGPNLVIGLANQQSAPAPKPSDNLKAPKSFQFDAGTDLNVELNQVNPEVSDQDFSQ